MTPFNAIVRHEGGSRRNLRITAPTNIVEQMRATGWRPPGWVRLHIDGYAPVFVMARYPRSRASVTCTLPAWAFKDLRADQRVRVRLEDPTPYKAQIEKLPAYAWLPLFEEDALYFPAQTVDGAVELWSRHEAPLKLDRLSGGVGFWGLVRQLHRTAQREKGENETARAT